MFLLLCAVAFALKAILYIIQQAKRQLFNRYLWRIVAQCNGVVENCCKQMASAFLMPLWVYESGVWISPTLQLEAVFFSFPSVFILHCKENISHFAYAVVYLCI